MSNPASIHSPGRPWWSALVIVSLLFLATPATFAKPTPAATPDQAYALYAYTWGATALTPLDPTTLADRKDVPPLTFTGVMPQLLLSANGSTLVAIEHHDSAPDTVIIRDGLYGSERLHFTLPNGAADSWLSREGDLLAISAYLARASGIWLWQVFDTHTGRIVAVVQCAGQRAAPDFIDPDGRRLYHPFYETPAESASGSMNRVPIDTSKAASPEPPWQLWIAAYDLATGKETGRVAVPGVMGGTWPRGDAVEGDPVMEMDQPAVALSPDGTHLAVVDAAGTKVTLVDARTLTVTGTHALHRPESAAHRFLRWLGVAPQTAEAKFMAGHQLSAIFAPDGRHLYVSGLETTVDAAQKTMNGKGLGVRRIDAETGAIVAEALAGSQLETVLPAPDGQSLYVSGATTPGWVAQNGPETWEVQRLDAQTLHPLAERTFPSNGSLTLVLVPGQQHG